MSLPCKCKYQITAQYSTFDEICAFTLLTMSVIQYLTYKWTYTCVVLHPGIVHVLKQWVKIVDVSVDRRCVMLVIYWPALVCLVWPNIWYIGFHLIYLFFKIIFVSDLKFCISLNRWRDGCLTSFKQIRTNSFKILKVIVIYFIVNYTLPYMFKHKK